jgi:hypothetical protein
MSRWSFTKHPESVGESWVEHMGQAWSFGALMIAAGLACLVHGLFPFLFVTTGSTTVRKLFDRMVANRRRHAEAADRVAAGLPHSS